MMYLSAEQRKLVEDNHNLIYGFIHRHNLPVDEYYGVLAIGLCKAAHNFKIGKCTFGTYAEYMFKHELYVARYYDNKQPKTVNTIVIQADSEDEGNEFNLLDKVAVTEDTKDTVCDEVVKDIIIEEFKSKLPDIKRKIFDLLIQEKKKKDIAEICGISKGRLSQIVTSIKNDFRRYLDANF